MMEVSQAWGTAVHRATIEPIGKTRFSPQGEVLGDRNPFPKVRKRCEASDGSAQFAYKKKRQHFAIACVLFLKQLVRYRSSPHSRYAAVRSLAGE